MLRRITMVALVVAVSGIVPLLANWGSCDDMPCCHHHGVVIGVAQSSDCCTPTNCAKEEKALRASTSVVQRTIMAAVLTATPLQPVMTARDLLPPLPALSPPSTSERLSSLSILII